MIIKNIVLDINKEYYKPILAKQGDASSRYLSILLLDDNTPFNLDGKAVKIYGKKQDGTTVFNDCEIIGSFNESFIKVELTSQMLAVPGILDIELMVLEDKAVLTTIPFKINVIKSINDLDAIESTNEFGAVIEALIQTENIKNSFEEEYQIINITFNQLEDKWETAFDEKFNNLEKEYAEELTSVKNEFSSIKNEFEDMKDQIVQNKPIILTDDYPVGGFMWFMKNGIPDNFLVCDGKFLNKSDYPELFEVIQYTWGGSGEQFKLPNMVDDALFIRAANNIHVFGLGEEDSFKSHNHGGITEIDNKYWNKSGFAIGNTGSSEGLKWTIPNVEGRETYGDPIRVIVRNDGGNETRPKNIALTPCIKVKQRAKDMVTVAQEWTQFKTNGGEIGGDVTINGDLNVNGTDIVSGLASRGEFIEWQFPKANTWYRIAVHSWNRIIQTLQFISYAHNGMTVGILNYSAIAGYSPTLQIEHCGLVNGGSIIEARLHSKGGGDVYLEVKTGSEIDTRLQIKSTGFSGAFINEVIEGSIPNESGWGITSVTFNRFPQSSPTKTGYTRLEGGLIMQWGEIIYNDSEARAGEQWFNLPIVYPNDQLACNVTFNAQDSNTNVRAMGGYGNINGKNQIHIRWSNDNLPNASTVTKNIVRWTSLGY